jgi:hypothetical protein
MNHGTKMGEPQEIALLRSQIVPPRWGSHVFVFLPRAMLASALCPGLACLRAFGPHIARFAQSHTCGYCLGTVHELNDLQKGDEVIQGSDGRNPSEKINQRPNLERTGGCGESGQAFGSRSAAS